MCISSLPDTAPRLQIAIIFHNTFSQRYDKLWYTTLHFPFLTRSERPATSGLLLTSNFGLSSVKNFKEFGNPVSHSRVHVGLGALDVVVQVIAEKLDAVDGSKSLGWICKVTREKNYTIALDAS